MVRHILPQRGPLPQVPSVKGPLGQNASGPKYGGVRLHPKQLPMGCIFLIARWVLIILYIRNTSSMS
jgi:hypothetical protein